MSPIKTTIDLSEFKTRYLEILEHLAAPSIILTSEGRPVAKITPLTPVNNEALIGSMKDGITINGDIFSTAIQGGDPVNSTFGMIQLPTAIAKEIADSQELE